MHLLALTNRGTYGGDVIGLQVEDDILYRLDTFLNGEVHLVVFTSNVSSNLMSPNKPSLKTPYCFLES